MNIAEFFVGLGVKGADKSNKQLQKTDSTLKSMHKNSLAMKAALAGAVYGMGRMMGKSAQMASGLNAFAAETGLSAQKLQQWQRNAESLGFSASEMTSSITGVQSAMARWRQFGETPEGLIEVQRILGGDFDTKKAWEDPFYVLERLQKVLKSGAYDAARMNELLSGFGASRGTLGFLRESGDVNKMKQFNVITERETKSLLKMKGTMTDIRTEVDKMMASFFAEHGNDLAKTFKDLVPILKNSLVVIGKLTGALVKMEKTLGLFQKAADITTDLVEGELGGKAYDAIDSMGLTTKRNQTITSLNPTHLISGYLGNLLADKMAKYGPTELKIEQNNLFRADSSSIAEDVRTGVSQGLSQASQEIQKTFADILKTGR